MHRVRAGAAALLPCRTPHITAPLNSWHARWLTVCSLSRSHGIYMAEKEKIKDGEEYVDKLVLCDKHRPADGAKKKRRKREIKW